MNDESVSKLTILRNRSLCKIRLMLGIDMDFDNKLLKCLNDIVSKKYINEEDFILDINELIQISKIYLKLKWERIKLEISNVDGKIIKNRLNDKEESLNKFYNCLNNIDVGND